MALPPRLLLLPLLLLLVVGLVLVAGQMGLLAGRRPPDLGAVDGRLKPVPASPNCVSSQSADAASRIAPYAYAGDGKLALQRLATIVAAMPRTAIVVSRPDYLHVEFRSRWLGFVDDVEFLLAEKEALIHLRSASRLGHSDFGVNRRRMEAIREEFAVGSGKGPPG